MTKRKGVRGNNHNHVYGGLNLTLPARNPFSIIENLLTRKAHS